MNVAQAIEELVDQHGWHDRTAFWVDDQRCTHAELHALARRTTAGLIACGVTSGDRVLLALPDGAGLVSAFLGAARIGATAVLVNPALTATDHASIAADCRPHLVVSDGDLAGRFPSARHATADELVTVGASVPAPPPLQVDPSVPLYVQYTSGTTGRPKGAIHTHGQLAAYHRCVGQGVLAMCRDDVLLSVSKLYFAYGFGNALVFPLFTGACSVLFTARPTPEQVAAAVERYRVTLLFAVPSFYAKLLASCPAHRFASLRAAVSAGERLLPALGERVTKFLAAPVLEQIGSTEAGHAYCANTVWDNVLGSLGRPVPECELELRDATGCPVTDGETGELWVRGPMIMPGYLGRPPGADGVLRDGWLNTRDRVSRNPDGTYVHHGRSDDIEVVGGINVAPSEIEAVLADHPGVREVAVVSVADGGASQLRAHVVPVANDVDRADLEAELIALARQHLAAFKVPKSVCFLPELPRTPSGKLRRFLLRER